MDIREEGETMKELEEFEDVEQVYIAEWKGQAVRKSDYQALLAYIKELSAAVHKIASAEFARDSEICECDDHLHVDCCTNADFYCPMCIAGRALLTGKKVQDAK